MPFDHRNIDWGRIVWLFAIALFEIQNKIYTFFLQLKLSFRLYFSLTDQRFQCVGVNRSVLATLDTSWTSSNNWMETILISNVVNLELQNRNWEVRKWHLRFNTRRTATYPVGNTEWINPRELTRDDDNFSGSLWALNSLQTTSSWDDLSVILFSSGNDNINIKIR